MCKLLVHAHNGLFPLRVIFRSQEAEHILLGVQVPVPLPQVLVYWSGNCRLWNKFPIWHNGLGTKLGRKQLAGVLSRQRFGHFGCLGMLKEEHVAGFSGICDQLVHGVLKRWIEAQDLVVIIVTAGPDHCNTFAGRRKGLQKWVPVAHPHPVNKEA
jgi:hypothetical protein